MGTAAEALDLDDMLEPSESWARAENCALDRNLTWCARCASLPADASSGFRTRCCASFLLRPGRLAHHARLGTWYST